MYNGKNCKNILFALAFSVFLFGLSGCSSYTADLRPNYPLDKQIVDTLEPTISWQDMSQNSGNTTYDIIIYERLDEGDIQAYGGQVANQKNPKKKVLYLEDVEGTSLKLDDVLRPDKTYYWSVRSRNGDVTSDWSQSETQVFTGISYHRRTNLFEFRSPKE